MRALLCTMTGLLGLVTPAMADIIYQHDFNGSAAASLNGTPVDVSPGGESWTLNNNTALDAWMADGTVVATGGGVDGQSSIQLPFTPVAGKIYTLKGRISLTTATGQWVGLGFSDALTNPDGESGLFAFGSINGLSWALHGDLGANSFQAFGGPQNTNLAVNTFSVNPTDVRTVLDTTGSLWKTEFYVTSDNLNGGNELLAGSFTYASNPSIVAVGFTKGQSVAGFIDSFSLEVTGGAIPEPSAAALIATGLMVRCATRRRR